MAPPREPGAPLLPGAMAAELRRAGVQSTSGAAGGGPRLARQSVGVSARSRNTLPRPPASPTLLCSPAVEAQEARETGARPAVPLGGPSVPADAPEQAPGDTGPASQRKQRAEEGSPIGGPPVPPRGRKLEESEEAEPPAQGGESGVRRSPSLAPDEAAEPGGGGIGGAPSGVPAAAQAAKAAVAEHSRAAADKAAATAQVQGRAQGRSCSCCPVAVGLQPVACS